MKEPYSIADEEVKDFITLADEKLILAKRKHWFVTFCPILNTLFIAIILIATLYLSLHVYLSSLPLFISISLLVISVATSRIVKVIIGWYCHMYIITNRRIMEVRHVPFSSYHVNDLLLDQMRVAEIDIDVGTIFNEIVGKGDVIVQLDQLAREHAFRLSDVAEPRRTAMYLTQVFGERRQNSFTNTLYRYQPKFVL